MLTLLLVTLNIKFIHKVALMSKNLFFFKSTLFQLLSIQWDWNVSNYLGNLIEILKVILILSPFVNKVYNMIHYLNSSFFY